MLHKVIPMQVRRFDLVRNKAKEKKMKKILWMENYEKD